MSRYLNIDCILAEEEPVMAETNCAFFSLGSALDVRSKPDAAAGTTPARSSTTAAPDGGAVRLEESDVPAKSTVAIPTWLALSMAQSGFVTPHLPAHYTPATFREFRQDPLAPNLKAKSEYYYDSGAVICSITGRDGLRARKSILALFQRRYSPCLLAADKKGHDVQDAMDKMDGREVQLTQSCYRDKKRMERFRGSMWKQ